MLAWVVNMWNVPLPTVYFLNTFEPQAADVKAYDIHEQSDQPCLTIC